MENFAIIKSVTILGMGAYPIRVMRACREAMRRVADGGSIVLYASSLALGFSVLVVGLLLHGDRIASPWAVGGLAAASFIAQRGRVRVSNGVDQSLALLSTLCAAMLFGSLAAICVGVVSMLAEFHRPFLRWSVYTCGRGINGAVMGATAMGVEGLAGHGVAGLAVAAALTAIVAEIMDVGFAAVTYRVRGNPTKELLRTLLPLSATAVPIYSTTLVLLVLAFRDLSSWTLPAFLLPCIGFQRLFLLYQNQCTYASSLADANRQLRDANLSFTRALVTALDARDSYTAGHSAAVAIYARDIAIELRLDKEEQTLAYQCGLVHDIGKIGIPSGVLEKRGQLSHSERILIEKHPVVGAQILAQIDDYAEIAEIVRHHHERFDGRGYPDGIAGDEIHVLARVIAVADSYNAMTSDRPYRSALCPLEAQTLLLAASGSQFDPEIVVAFLEVLERSTMEYRLPSAHLGWSVGVTSVTEQDRQRDETSQLSASFAAA